MTRRGVARALSVALHPLVVMLLATPAWRAALVLALVVAVPFTIFMVRQVRLGRWENVDASRPQERPRLFVFALALMGVLMLVFRDSPPMVRGVGGAAAMFAVAWALLRWVKVSLHVACASMAAVTLLRTAPALGVAMALLVPLLA